jgi:hypothetical protein
MRLALTSNAIPASVPESKTEAVKAPPAIGARVQDVLKGGSQEHTLTGPLDRLDATGGFSFGGPVQVAPGVDFFPLVNDLINPGINPNLANDLSSGVSAVMDASSPRQRAWKVLELAENLPELPRVASATVHALGVLRATLDLKNVRKKTDSKNKHQIKVSAAAGQVAAALFKLATDCPGLESAKPAADRLAAVMKVGDKICLIDQTATGAVRAL